MSQSETTRSGRLVLGSPFEGLNSRHFIVGNDNLTSLFQFRCMLIELVDHLRLHVEGLILLAIQPVATHMGANG